MNSKKKTKDFYKIGFLFILNVMIENKNLDGWTQICLLNIWRDWNIHTQNFKYGLTIMNSYKRAKDIYKNKVDRNIITRLRLIFPLYQKELCLGWPTKFKQLRYTWFLVSCLLKIGKLEN